MSNFCKAAFADCCYGRHFAVIRSREILDFSLYLVSVSLILILPNAMSVTEVREQGYAYKNTGMKRSRRMDAEIDTDETDEVLLCRNMLSGLPYTSEDESLGDIDIGE